MEEIPREKPHFQEIRRFAKEEKVAIFGHLAKPVVWQKVQKRPTFTLSLQMPKS